jgi:hypothetical protein
MQRLLLQAICWLALASYAYAQQVCPVPTISTNPNNPINTQVPGKANTFFDWTQRYWTTLPYGTCRPEVVESPFYAIDNLEELRAIKDMQWEDGWELIRTGLGIYENGRTAVESPQHIYVILYNRYTGVFRVLLRNCSLNADYQMAQITLSMPDLPGATSIHTDLLEFSRPVTALDKGIGFTPTSFSAGARYLNDNSKWFYADFPMMYDPCTCMNYSKLQVSVSMVTQSKIEFKGTLEGEMMASNGALANPGAGSASWRTSVGRLNAKLLRVHGSVGKFRSEIEKQQAALEKMSKAGSLQNKADGIKNLSTALQNSAFIRIGMAAVPGLDAALGLVDVFVGGGQKSAGPQSVALTPTSISLSASLSGTVTTATPYQEITFAVPGAKDGVEDPDIYPYYNQPLGIFNLIKTPEVRWDLAQLPLNHYTLYPGKSNSSLVNVHLFALDPASFQYVLNPAAGMTIQQMKVALVTSAEYGNSYYTNGNGPEHKAMARDFVYEGAAALPASDSTVYYEHRFRTAYYDGNNIGKKVFKALSPTSPYVPSSDFGLWSTWHPKSGTPQVWVKIILNLRRHDADDNTQNVLYVVTYPAKMVASAGLRYAYESGIGAPAIPPPATVPAVRDFCLSNRYQPNRTLRLAGTEAALPELASRIGTGEVLSLWPNPSGGAFRVALRPEAGKVAQASLIDMSGKETALPLDRLRELGQDQGAELLVEADLPKGAYVLRVVTSLTVLQQRVVIQ